MMSVLDCSVIYEMREKLPKAETSIINVRGSPVPDGVPEVREPWTTRLSDKRLPEPPFEEPELQALQ